MIQREYRIVIAGPTTLVALLNSLQVGFRTLAIEKRSGEVWKILGAVKAQFDAFGEILSRIQRKLQQATNEIETVGTKTRTMQRKLRDVENMGVDASNELFGFANGEDSTPQIGPPDSSEEPSRSDAA
jgi:DNA recombination protein RmuC